MKRQEFDAYIKEHDFASLFNELGWNNPDQAAPVLVAVEEERYKLVCVAQRNGFKVYTCSVGEISLMTAVKAIDKRLRKSGNDYILIFVSDSEPLHHEWIVPVKTVDKRVLVPVAYTTTAQADFLYSKHLDLSFDLEEETTILDVTKRVNAVFELNAEKVTKDFYAGFKKQHNQFAEFISGISVEGDKQWYVSVMLNRLMFCYFIQKKNFLDFNPNYLRDKLNECKQKEGKDKFFKSFYKSFLIQLFHGGLNNPAHDTSEFKKIFGRIPYLNGGMFDEHIIEKQYADIDIADEAFENLFAFFDKYHWHLDTRIEASGKDINPDVLGYIFEQYINDRAQMGAYYTKEDITNYIGKNCILPFLWDKTLDTLIEAEANSMFDFLKNSGDTYIYDAVKHGVKNADGTVRPLPSEIEIGMDTEKRNLLERRKNWNTPTPSDYGLPTEIWRETVERRNRCIELEAKISGGEIRSVNDFITYNLDIVRFTQDILQTTDDSNLLLAFYRALQSVTILDPTCGSGAFLFAAMNILEPLYDICLDSMEEFARHSEGAAATEESTRIITEMTNYLSEIKNNYRSNRAYFIYKNIILKNLYGVDIMPEAAEIAKLRLFLKMVAVVEADRKLENLGLDPLPDIDFNIKSGNTLVGYATEKELMDDLTYNDMFAREQFEKDIRDRLQKVAGAFKNFKAIQLTQNAVQGGHAELDSVSQTPKQVRGDSKVRGNVLSASDIKTAKADLQGRLAELNDILNKKAFAGGTASTYEKWLKDYQPFHWLAEYYEIIAGRGGFDVIIGNPPYINIKKVNYITENDFCTDLYAFVIRRVFALKQPLGRHGFIVMHNLAFSRDFKELRTLLKNQNGQFWFSFYGRIPSGLFSGDVRVRNCIYIFSPTNGKSYTTRLHRWFAEYRDTLFQLTKYSHFEWKEVVPMFNSQVLSDFYNTISPFPEEIKRKKYGAPIYFKRVAYNWVTATEKMPPCYDGKTGEAVEQTKVGTLFCDLADVPAVVLFFCGKMFFTYWLTYGDEFDVTKDILLSFYPNLSELTDQDRAEIDRLYKEFTQRLDSTVSFKLNAGKKVGTYQTATMWDLTDVSDTIFLKHLTATPEIVKEAIEDTVAASVVTGKKDLGSELDEG